MSDFADLRVTLDAAIIISSCPLWPRVDFLSESGKALHDAILATAKDYARAVASDEISKALGIAAGWTGPCNRFMDETLINSPDAQKRLHNRRLLRVYLHYLDATRLNYGILK